MIGTEPTLGVAAATTAELFVLLSPTGPYFATGLKPVNLLADPRYVRAWPGGSGYSKMGSNYAPTLWISVNINTKNSVNFRNFWQNYSIILFREKPKIPYAGMPLYCGIFLLTLYSIK